VTKDKIVWKAETAKELLLPRF